MANQKRNNRTRLSVQAEEPVRAGDVWEIEVSALASRGREALEGEIVDFYQNGAYLSSIQTDTNGRAETRLTSAPDDRRVSVEAQLQNQPWTSRTTVEIPQSSAPKPHSFEANVIGANGNYRVLVMVRGEDRSPLKGVKVQILNASNGDIVRSSNTKEDGIASFLQDVPDDEVCELEVFVYGLQSSRRPQLLRLKGRSNAPDPEPIPDAPERPKLDLANAWRRGWQKGRK